MKKNFAILLLPLLLACTKKGPFNTIPPILDPSKTVSTNPTQITNTQVYVGGGDNDAGAFVGYLNDPTGWPYVRQYANGYYTNNFALNTNTADATQNSKLGSMSSLFTNKNVFYETDLARTDDNSDMVKIGILKARGFGIPLCVINRGVSATRIASLKSDMGPIVLGMGAPWQVTGDINSTLGASWRTAIDNSQGSGTDGPLGLWKTNQGDMQNGSISGVKYAHSKGKLAMVMMAPYQSGTGAEFLRVGKLCVQQHEDAGANPDIWAIEYYAAQLEQYPVTPEKISTGEPAASVTGLAYYLIRHLRGEAKALLNTAASNSNIVDKGTSVEVKLPVSSSGDVSFSVPLNVISTDDAWLDVCPLIKATLTDNNKNYAVNFTLNGLDVTNDLLNGGFACFKDYRLQGAKKLNMVVNIVSTKKIAAAQQVALDIKLDLFSHPGSTNKLSSSLIIKCTTL